MRIVVHQIHHLSLLIYRIILTARLLTEPIELLILIRVERGIRLETVSPEILKVEPRKQRLRIRELARQQRRGAVRLYTVKRDRPVLNAGHEIAIPDGGRGVVG